MDPREFEYVFFGMLAVWLIITLYALSLGIRERKLKAELDRVRRMIEKT